jgi:hypothetical protein
VESPCPEKHSGQLHSQRVARKRSTLKVDLCLSVWVNINGQRKTMKLRDTVWLKATPANAILIWTNEWCWEKN